MSEHSLITSIINYTCKKWYILFTAKSNTNANTENNVSVANVEF